VTRAVLSLGSNLGDRFAFLQGAVTGLREHLWAVSPVYETAAWGVAEQPDFLNAIVIVSADGVDEWGWLRMAQNLENEAGRVRVQHWGPRTLDVDVVTVDAVSCDHPDLLLPHPGTSERATVLVPWLDIEPDAVLPGHGPIKEVMAGLSADGVRRRDDLRLEW
jgi:2-amino-4-hydroxy-6-hydroxymethyldihydropteridine diphosphokinase